MSKSNDDGDRDDCVSLDTCPNKEDDLGLIVDDGTLLASLNLRKKQHVGM